MKKILLWLVLILLLSSCAGSPVRTTWSAKAHTKAMIRLRADMTPEEVIKIMGRPDKTEMYRGKNNEPVLVYHYITEGKDTFSRRWTEANYTPHVFVNNYLAGWGWNYFRNTAQKYEIIIKDLY